MENDEELAYLDDLIKPFYEAAPNDINYVINGQLCWAPVNYLQYQTDVWRPVFRDNDEFGFASADYFVFTVKPHDLFKHEKPLKYPQDCSTKEEFVFQKAKLRPVIIINQSKVDPNIKEARYGHKVKNYIFLVIPLYSIQDPDSERFKFHQETVDKTRLLYFNNLFFIPSNPSFHIRDSISRIDQIFPINKSLLRSIPIKLVDEALMIIKEQLFSILFGYKMPEGVLNDYIDLLRNQS